MADDLRRTGLRLVRRSVRTLSHGHSTAVAELRLPSGFATAPRPRPRTRLCERLAELLGERTDEILEANAADLDDGRAAGARRRAARPAHARPRRGSRRWPTGVRAIVALPDPVGEVIEQRTLASGLELEQAARAARRRRRRLRGAAERDGRLRRARLKSGNAIVLRGSSSAARSNAALAAVVREAVAEAGLPEGTVELLDGGERDELAELATAEGLVDLIIPRGRRGPEGGAEGGRRGAGHVRGRRATATSTCTRTPTSRWRGGSPTTRRCSGPGVCNSAETLLVHARRRRGVPARGARASCATPGSSWSATSGRARPPAASRSARRRDEDWDTEYLG